MASEPQLIDGSWWKQDEEGDWFQFDFDSSTWMPGRPAGIPDRPVLAPEERVPRPALTHYDRTVPVMLEEPNRFADGGRIPPVLWATLAAGVLVALGSLGPWVTFFVFSVAGTSSEIGICTLLAGGAASGLSILRMKGKGRWTLIVCAIGFGLCAAVGILVWTQLEMLTNSDNAFASALSVGWGLVIMTIAASSGVVLSVLSMRTPSGDGNRGLMSA